MGIVSRRHRQHQRSHPLLVVEDSAKNGVDDHPEKLASSKSLLPFVKLILPTLVAAMTLSMAALGVHKLFVLQLSNSDTTTDVLLRGGKIATEEAPPPPLTQPGIVTTTELPKPTSCLDTLPGWACDGHAKTLKDCMETLDGKPTIFCFQADRVAKIPAQQETSLS